MPIILTDIEGTTTPIDFVHKTLFPYSARHLPDFVREHAGDPEVKKCLEMVIATVMEESRLTIDEDEAIHMLLKWIQDDRKHPALKELQGLVWEHGYKSGAFTSEIYDDVLPALRRWREKNIGLAIYSSGSVKAQQLLFAHTPEGDLTPFFSHYFDTGVGHKQEVNSYRNILQALGAAGSDVLFLSDVEKELDAAAEAGMRTTQLVRPGTTPGTRHPTAKTFAEIDPP